MSRQAYMDSDETMVTTTTEKRSIAFVDPVVPRDPLKRRSSQRAAKSKSWTAKLQAFLGKYHIEQRGIEPVPEDERTDTNGVITIGTMVRCPPPLNIFYIILIRHGQWLAANMVVSSFAVGALATPVFKLGFLDTVLTILFINMLAAIPVAFWSTFGPVLGMRQMVLSRYYFGYHGIKLSWVSLPLYRTAKQRLI